MDEGLKAKIDNYYAPNTVALLINDDAGILDSTSTMSDVASLELPSGNGYSRISLTIPASFMESGTPKKARSDANQITFTAQGGNIPVFSHICFVVGGNTTVGDTTGIIDRIEPVNNGTPTGLNNGESYKHSFIQRESGNYITS
jgi:hypothetical protein